MYTPVKYLSDGRGDVSVRGHEIQGTGAVIGTVGMIDVALGMYEHRRAAAVEEHHSLAGRKHRPVREKLG